MVVVVRVVVRRVAGCVTAWKIETRRPTTRLTPRTGIEICSVSHIVRAPISMIWLWSI